MLKIHWASPWNHRTIACALLFWVATAGTAQAQAVNQNRLFTADSSQFGTALAAAGTTLAVGDAFSTTPSGNTVGAIHLFAQAGEGWTTGPELTANDGQSFDMFGYSVADSGAIVAVGAPLHSGTGAVYVFNSNASGWKQTQELLPPDGADGDFFGAAIALTSTTLAVGAFEKSGGAGVVYVYALVAGKWVLQAELPAPNAVPASPASFGFSVALAGTTLLVGAPGQNAGAGTAYVYALSAGTWSLQAQITPNDATSGGQFGYAVALSGTLAGIGAPGASAAYLYQPHHAARLQARMRQLAPTTVSWSVVAELAPFEGDSITGFGSALALNATTFVVSALNTDDREAYVFGLQNGTWSPKFEPVPIDNSLSNGGYGTAVALVGGTVAISRPYLEDLPQLASSPQGAVYTFAFGAEIPPTNGIDGGMFGYAVAGAPNAVVVGAPRRNANTGGVTSYTHSTTGALSLPVALKASDGQPGDAYGSALAFDGNTLFVAAPNANTGQGAVYVYTYSGGTWTPAGKLTASDGQPGDAFGTALSMSGGNLAVGAPGANGNLGTTYVFTVGGGQWTQQSELIPPDGNSGDGFGTSVGLSGTSVVIGSPNASPNGGLNVGSAYVYGWNGTQWTLTKELSAPDGQPFDQFGAAVAISGNQIAVGAPYGDVTNGAVYLYAANGTGWGSEGELTGGLHTSYGDLSGSAIVLSGNTLLVSAPGHQGGLGLVTVYTQSAGQWTEANWLSAVDGQFFDSFGSTIGIAGSNLVVGAPYANSGTGSLYTY